MQRVTHREMRNQSGEILRRVAEGETVEVTNRGQVAALIVPPGADGFTELIARGQVREARKAPSSLRSIVRRASAIGVDAIIADTRGRW